MYVFYIWVSVKKKKKKSGKHTATVQQQRDVRALSKARGTQFTDGPSRENPTVAAASGLPIPKHQAHWQPAFAQKPSADRWEGAAASCSSA